MGDAYIVRRGGSFLNFKVVGGTSAPANPAENTIWVNTSIPITSGIFSATQPTGATGKVWIKTAASSAVAFNALKKNGIQVYPVAYFQHSGSAWEPKVGHVWQNGAWKATTLTVVPNSASYGSVEWTKSDSNVTVTASSTSTVIKTYAKVSDPDYAYVPVDVSNYKKMTIAGTFVSADASYQQGGTLNVGLTSSPTGGQAVGFAETGIDNKETVSIPETSYDISGLTGTYYFRVYHANPYGTQADQQGTLTLTKVMFE